MKKSILFIINPITGKKNTQSVIKIINKYIDHENFTYDIKITNYQGEAEKITLQNIDKYQAIIAVGGDGTLNEVARVLINKHVTLGIIPTGSGNGLARCLKIPMKIKKNVQLINNFNTRKIDACLINDNYFFNIAGIGFDAEIAHLFNQSKNRGFINYIKLVASYFFKYKGKEYELKFNNQKIKLKTFLISFANSTQFGNNAHINPKGLLDDGLIECCILKKFPLLSSPALVIQLFTKTLHKSKYFMYYQSKQFELVIDKNINGHIDGDAVIFNNMLQVKIMPEAINIICN